MEQSCNEGSQRIIATPPSRLQRFLIGAALLALCCTEVQSQCDRNNCANAQPNCSIQFAGSVYCCPPQDSICGFSIPAGSNVVTCTCSNPLPTPPTFAPSVTPGPTACNSVVGTWVATFPEGNTTIWANVEGNGMLDATYEATGRFCTCSISYTGTFTYTSTTDVLSVQFSNCSASSCCNCSPFIFESQVDWNTACTGFSVSVLGTEMTFTQYSTGSSFQWWYIVLGVGLLFVVVGIIAVVAYMTVKRRKSPVSNEEEPIIYAQDHKDNEPSLSYGATNSTSDRPVAITQSLERGTIVSHQVDTNNEHALHDQQNGETARSAQDRDCVDSALDNQAPESSSSLFARPNDRADHLTALGD